jgi:citrate synthase
MQPWRTAIVNKDETHIWIRGYDITQLMGQAGFVDTVFLLHRGRLPNPGERRLLDALLVASADHGAGAPSCATARLAASGNRGSLSAAVAAGILAIGDEHGGAGEICMTLIANHAPAGKRASKSEGGVQGAPPLKSMDEAAAAAVENARQNGGRLPGLGHRIHTTDPRVAVLFGMAADLGIAGDGIAFMRAIESAAARLIKPLPINIDGALAGVLYDMGFPPSAAKLIFIIGRVAGLTAEVAEEHAREKPMRVRIPIEYDGEPPREIDKTEE